jgi:hypothetical protein
VLPLVGAAVTGRAGMNPNLNPVVGWVLMVLATSVLVFVLLCMPYRFGGQDALAEECPLGSPDSDLRCRWRRLLTEAVSAAELLLLGNCPFGVIALAGKAVRG